MVDLRSDGFKRHLSQDFLWVRLYFLLEEFDTNGISKSWIERFEELADDSEKAGFEIVVETVYEC